VTSAQRWARIAELHAAMRAAWAAESSRQEKRRNKGAMEKSRVAVYDTPEYIAIVEEYRALEDIERTAAIEADWPVWQEHQHFTFLHSDCVTLGEGEVLAFDRDAMTASTWPMDGVCASLRGGKPVEIVTVAQIVAGELLRDEQDDERNRQHAIAMGPQQADLFAQERQ
jgi:hypothetical protein